MSEPQKKKEHDLGAGLAAAPTIPDVRDVGQVSDRTTREEI